MTRQREVENENKQEKRDKMLLKVVSGGLDAAVRRAGGDLTGFTAKIDPVECLLVIKAVFPGGPMVAFCGSADLASALVKAAREASRDNLRWRPDKYQGPGTIAKNGEND